MKENGGTTKAMRYLTYRSVPFNTIRMTHLAVKDVGGAEAQMLQWQHTSYLSLDFVRHICGFDMLEVV